MEPPPSDFLLGSKAPAGQAGATGSRGPAEAEGRAEFMVGGLYAFMFSIRLGRPRLATMASTMYCATEGVGWWTNGRNSKHQLLAEAHRRYRESLLLGLWDFSALAPYRIANSAGSAFHRAGPDIICSIPCPNREVVHRPDAIRAISRSKSRCNACVIRPGNICSKAIPL